MLYSAGRFEFFSEIANRKTFSNLQSECFFPKKTSQITKFHVSYTAINNMHKTHLGLCVCVKTSRGARSDRVNQPRIPQCWIKARDILRPRPPNQRRAVRLPHFRHDGVN